GDAPDVGEDVVEAGDAEVRHAEGAGGDAAAREIDRAVTDFLRHQRVVRVDRADDLEGLLLRERLPELGSSAHRTTHFPNRCFTGGMNVVSSQAWSVIIGQTFLPSLSAWNTSGYCVAEWLPQTTILRMSVTFLPIFCATCEVARLWSSRIMPVNCAGLRLGAF